MREENKVNWTIEMFSFSTRMREMLTKNFFPYKLIPYELYWFFSGLTCMYLKGAYLKYHGPKKKFLENYLGICNDKTINYRSLTLILGSAYLFLSVFFSSLCLSWKNSWDKKRVLLMFAVLCLLRILLWYLHACCLDGINLGVYCLGLFFDKLCTVFAGNDQICVHKATVWSGLLHWTWNRE